MPDDKTIAVQTPSTIPNWTRAADLARTRGFEPTFHHHTATFVEAPWEIERLLELTDVGLLLDTVDGYGLASVRTSPNFVARARAVSGSLTRTRLSI